MNPTINMNTPPMDQAHAQMQAPIPPEAVAPMKMPIGSEQVKELIQILQKYKSGKALTDQRIIASENWWKLRNSAEEQSATDLVKKGFTSKSGWLHNVIVSKHADAMEAYPEPNVLPREEGDRGEARMLSAIVPCVLEQNNFEETYDDAMWRKMKGGTAVYKIVWDKNKLNGLGDISVECANILNLYWEPGVTDIQKSRYFFHTELLDKDLLQERYPDILRDGLKGNDFISSKFLYDDHVDTENKTTVVECYYHKYIEGKNTLQYVKFVGDTVLYATENEMEMQVDEMGQPKAPMALAGLYDHGKYPYKSKLLLVGYESLCKELCSCCCLFLNGKCFNSLLLLLVKTEALGENAVGLTHMRAKNNLCAIVEKVLNGRKCANDSLIRGDNAILHRYVKVAANKDCFAGYFNVFNCFLVISCHKFFSFGNFFP